jgi:hypothetical protein
VSGSIRKTDFTWDPRRESRSAVWRRIKTHVQAELERIETETKQQIRHERWRAAPTYQRDRTMLVDHDLRAIDISTLARQHQISTTRVREILRRERFRQRRERMTGVSNSSATRSPSRQQWIDLPGGFPQTSTVPTDP